MSTATALPINTIASGLALRDLFPGTIGRSAASQGVEERISEALGHAASLHHLGSEYLAYLSPDWDGDGASPIALETMINANLFLEKIASLNVAPEVCPEADGYIQFEWYIDPERVFSVSFGPSNVISFSGINCGGCSIYGEGSVSNGFPKAAWACIEEIAELYKEQSQAA